jgi:hypothetical protein
MGQRITVRWRGCFLLLAALLCLGFAACDDADSSALTLPTVVAYQTPTPTATIPTTTFTLACAVNSSEGSEDDETEQTLTCKVTHAPAADTRFTLHYGVRDPVGTLHPLSQTCDGTLHAGVGTCRQTYEFVFAFPAAPGPVTGESLPSHQPLGPVMPTT